MYVLEGGDSTGECISEEEEVIVNVERIVGDGWEVGPSTCILGPSFDHDPVSNVTYSKSDDGNLRALYPSSRRILPKPI